MKEVYEFRVNEDHAHLVFGPNDGVRLSDMVRKVLLAADDPRFEEMKKVQAHVNATGGSYLFSGWQIHRKYTRQELVSSQLLELTISTAFEPVGEECGTLYDESSACVHCGAGRRQVSELRLDLRKAPKTKDISRTIADEWIISQRLAELLMDSGMKGFDLRRVRHKARYVDDPVDFSKVPAGREILRVAEERGWCETNWEYAVWLNREENLQLVQRAHQEHAALAERKARKQANPVRVWYQLLITSRPIGVIAPTRIGIDPFDDDPHGRFRCPLGHVSGLNVLSELTLARDDWDGSDLGRTSNLFGHRRGVLVPRPIPLISQRLWHLLESANIKGYKVEVAHLK